MITDAMNSTATVCPERERTNRNIALRGPPVGKVAKVYIKLGGGFAPFRPSSHASGVLLRASPSGKTARAKPALESGKPNR
jgi:hypothetical protein